MSNSNKLENALKKELISVIKAEAKLKKKADTPVNSYKEKLEAKIPEGINSALQKAFSKAFGLVFSHGIGIIEKGYDKGRLADDFDIQNYAIDKKSSRKEIRKLKNSAWKSDFVNMTVTTAEGLGLGVLGIGLPDIVLFTGMILKGIYEASLRCGYDYESSQERYLILLMMKAALSKGEERERFDAEVDRLFSVSCDVSDDVIKCEIDETAKCFATDMLVMKFIQGLPVIGVVGGVFNPVYYNRIMNYVRLKYYKRYLLDKLKSL